MCLCCFFLHGLGAALKQKYRLRGGAVPWSGRVEVRVNNEWGTVCDTGFNVKAGNIVCRKLGFGTIKKITGRASYGRGVGAIHMTQLRCVNIGMEHCAKVKLCLYHNATTAKVVGWHNIDAHVHTSTAVVDSECPTQCQAIVSVHAPE